MDLFLTACGAIGPLQLRLDGPGGSWTECRSFDTPAVVIGRDPQSDLVFEHREVSPRHAYLQLIGGRLYCADLGSQSGTSVGGQKWRAGWVEPQQVIRVGPYRIRVADGGLPVTGAAGELELPSLRLDLSHRGFKASEGTIAGGVSLVGSSTDCPVRLLDPGVSNIHCSLVSTPGGVWALDLFGKGGIAVNGKSVRHGLLRVDDELRVGRSTIRVRDEVQVQVQIQVPVPADVPAPEIAAPAVEEPPQPAAFAAYADEPQPVEEPEPERFWEDSEPESEMVPAPEPVSVREPYDDDWEPAEPELHSTIRKHQMEDQRLAELSAAERRASCRYPVLGVDAVLSWWEPIACPAAVLAQSGVSARLDPAAETVYARMMARWPGSHNGTPAARAAAELARDPLPPVQESMTSHISGARLVDISQTGLLVLSDAVPPADQRVWLRLERPQTADWVEVVVKGATPTKQGAHRVRLAFRDACPYDFFKAVVYQKPGA